jgi:hypothetical protein
MERNAQVPTILTSEPLDETLPMALAMLLKIKKKQPM